MSEVRKIEELRSLVREERPDLKKIESVLESLKLDIAESERRLQILSEKGAELSQIFDQPKALELILTMARELTNADGGTVYILDEKYHDDPFNPGEIKSRHLSFEVLQNESLDIFLKRSTRDKDILPPVSLENEAGPNNTNVCAYCANSGKIINIADVYDAEGFDFTGAKKYDQTTGYRSQSMLVIPLRDHENEINGVLQLINRRGTNGEVVAFSASDQLLVQTMTYQTAISLTTKKLLQEQVRLFDSFVKVLAEGLGEKSSHTYGHINRVAKLTQQLAESIHDFSEGMYEGIRFNKNEMEEIRLAAWMHDIGKLTTPEWIVSKSIKLESITDRFDLITERINSKIKDIKIRSLEAKLKCLEKGGNPLELKKIEDDKNSEIEVLTSQFQIINKSNLGGEFLEESQKEIIESVSKMSHIYHLKETKKAVAGQLRTVGSAYIEEGEEKPLISEVEKNLLSISRGTLSTEEREEINNHARRSWNWLMKLPFPKKMMKLPLYAGAHHETLKGTGYPNQLIGEQLPIQSRIIAVADIFEALTANDRPYRQPMGLERALDILGKMVLGREIDAEIVKIFLKSGLYMTYAEQYLSEKQLAEIDVDKWIEKFYPKDFSNTLPKKN